MTLLRAKEQKLKENEGEKKERRQINQDLAKSLKQFLI